MRDYEIAFIAQVFTHFKAIGEFAVRIQTSLLSATFTSATEGPMILLPDCYSKEDQIRMTRLSKRKIVTEKQTVDLSTVAEPRIHKKLFDMKIGWEQDIGSGRGFL